jgi:hypothetical protein
VYVLNIFWCPQFFTVFGVTMELASTLRYFTRFRFYFWWWRRGHNISDHNDDSDVARPSVSTDTCKWKATINYSEQKGYGTIFLFLHFIDNSPK